MSKDKNKTDMADAQLDRLMGLYEVPELDADAFNQKLFSRLGQDGAGATNSDNQHIMIWSRPWRFAAFTVVVLLSAGLLFSKDDFEKRDAGQIQTASVSIGVEKTVVPAGNEITDVDRFLNEIIDQDIAVLEYSVAMNTGPEKESATSQEEDQDMPPIDSFLDELLGIESRTL
jgi:hypothetical protein